MIELRHVLARQAGSSGFSSHGGSPSGLRLARQAGKSGFSSHGGPGVAYVICPIAVTNPAAPSAKTIAIIATVATFFYYTLL